MPYVDYNLVLNVENDGEVYIKYKKQFFFSEGRYNAIGSSSSWTRLIERK